MPLPPTWLAQDSPVIRLFKRHKPSPKTAGQVSVNAVVAPATGYNMVDALAAAPLAAALNAPVLLTDGDQLSAEAKAEITRLGVKTVYVTSGLAVIKAGVIADLQGYGR